MFDSGLRSNCSCHCSFNKVVSEPVWWLSMANTRIEVERFDGKGHFSLWKKRMLSHLSVLSLKDVLEESTSPSVSAIQKEEDEDVYRERLAKEEAERLGRSETAMNMISLSMGDHVLRNNKLCTSTASS